MIGLGFLYLVAGVTFGAFAMLSITQTPRRPGNALFYALIAVSFLFGDRLGDFANGLLVLAIVGVATLGRMGAREAETSDAPVEPRGAMLFVPALVIPASANTAPRLASICGRIAAQPIWSISRVPCRNGSAGAGLSQA
jgi:uncharacterized membrane protein